MTPGVSIRVTLRIIPHMEDFCSVGRLKKLVLFTLKLSYSKEVINLEKMQKRFIYSV